MAKLKDNKGFKAGLEQLLMDAMGEDNPMLSAAPTETKTTPKSKPVVARKKKPRSPSSKSFSSDLNSLFNDSIVESVQERVKQIKQQPKKEKTEEPKAVKQSEKKPPRGLDLLIRQTVESSKVNISREPRRRITFLFEEEKIKRLKDIAQDRRAYIKDIIGDIVSEYIEDYEKESSANQK